MVSKLARGLVIGAGIFFLAGLALAAERPLFSDKSIPVGDQIEKALPDRLQPVQIEPAPEFEQSFPLQAIPILPELAKTLKLEQIDHPRVQYYMEYFTGPFHDHFQIWLDRSGYYKDYIQEQLREHQLPESLFYLAFIESGMNPYAYSRAGAGGMWQFMPGTGIRYGLRVDFWVDERRDLDKSTQAAIAYLTDLYNRFGSWPLAAASYNAGEGKVSWAMGKYDTDDYWELIEYKCLRRETRDYLPKMIAASIIAENPELYGFTKPQKLTESYDKIEVTNPVDLNKVAHYCGTTIDEMRWLNPSLRRDVSPPDTKFEIRIPTGTRDQFIAALEKLKPEQILSYYRHRVRSGETLSHICQRYDANMWEIQKVNHLSGTLIRAGQVLIIPVPMQASSYRPQRTAAAKPAPQTQTRQTSAGKVTVRYKVAKGDTLYSICQAAEVDLASVKSWNKITSTVSVGQELVLYLTSSQASKFQAWTRKNKLASAGPELKKVYQVKPGDSVYQIAARYQVSPQDVMEWNNLTPASILKPGENLVLILPEKK